MQNFDRVVCVSLKRRPDRREAFLSRVPEDFPWGEIEIFDAIDGKICKHPKWWKQGGGAWGCYRSHLAIIEQTLMAGGDSVLIFEDDATFCEDFTKKALEYFSKLPEDWGQAYLGGQHLKRPQEFHDGYVRCLNVNRTHAYALKGQGLRRMYSWLHNTSGWINRNHIDHHMGRLHGQRGIEVFAPYNWLCGQAEDKRSDVCWKAVGERWWTMRPPTASELGDDVELDRVAPDIDSECRVEPKFVAVLGCHRSGSSMTAMMCHKLGINMGDKLIGFEGARGGGGEAVTLSHICEKYVGFPKTEVLTPDAADRRMRAWVSGRLRRHAVSGAKYPTLCLFKKCLKGTAGNRLLVINCNRPIEDSIASLAKRSAKAQKKWLQADEQTCRDLQLWIRKNTDDFIASMPAGKVLDLDYYETLEDPEGTVQKIIDFVGIKPTEEQIEAAIQHVNPEYRTV